ncbi:MAG: alpha/beta fold hydrolase [Deltaproteobacteria bacterium]|nr:alpha/beta fold hydrolase [Deltaproteobacteria bacterium]
MSDSSLADYSSLDHPEVLALLFHPRPEWSAPAEGDGVEVMSIPVEDGVSLGAKLHQAGKSAPVILFFHGNGEIVSDYDDLGPMYVRMGINFFPVDYRGYGRSTGSPTVTGMMRDCHVIFDYVKQRLKQGGYSGPIIVMGRSLGSASALELAAHYEDEIDGLVIESGFANIIPLLRLVGVDIDRLGISEKDDLHNIDKIRGFHKSVLVIHAEYDHIIPFSDGQALFNACASSDKRFLKISGADHNTIFAKGIEDYTKEVKRLADEAIKQKAKD